MSKAKARETLADIRKLKRAIEAAGFRTFIVGHQTDSRKPTPKKSKSKSSRKLKP